MKKFWQGYEHQQPKEYFFAPRNKANDEAGQNDFNQ